MVIECSVCMKTMVNIREAEIQNQHMVNFDLYTFAWIQLCTRNHHADVSVHFSAVLHKN